MARRSKSKFTDLVKFIPDPDDSAYDEGEENNEIRTNILDTKYDDDGYDEYDEYIEEPDSPVVKNTFENIQEAKEVEIKVEDNSEIEEKEPVVEAKEQEIVEEIVEENIEEDDMENNFSDEEYEEKGNAIIEMENLDDIKEYNSGKVDNNMKREVPDFIKEEDASVSKPHVGAQRYTQQTQSIEPPANIKESIILGNTTIKGDVITDTGIQIYGAVIGNIESGGRVQLMGKVEGDISGKSVVITDTSLNGNIHAENDVMIKQGCIVNGDVSGEKIVLNGDVKGNIEANGQVDFEAGSSIEGNVSARSFNIRPGARINGSISTI